jgi:tetratricopeptide (TPR) repeat protein
MATLRTLCPLALLLLTACTSLPSKALADEYYNLGNSWFELKKYDLAAAAYQKAVNWNPELKIASLNWARALAESGDAAGALRLLAPLAATDPDNLVVAKYRAWLTAKDQGAAAAADQYAALAAKLPGDADTLFNAGLCLKAAGRKTEALAMLTTWQTLDGKNAAGMALLAELTAEADPAKAADVWLAAVQALPENDPKRFAPLTSRAKALEAAKLYGDAVQVWTAALALPPADDQPRGESEFRLGSLYLLQIEDYQQGLAALLAAWKAGYKNKDAWSALRGSPDLKFAIRLEADLKLAGVTP